MIIKDIFAKDINRNIRGVIKIGQEAETIKKQELEEYVVTDELQSHFKRFFSAYVNSINRPTDATGVWISGFFGSGKSHTMETMTSSGRETRATSWSRSKWWTRSSDTMCCPSMVIPAQLIRVPRGERATSVM